MTTVETVVVDLSAGATHADHYAIRHKPSGRFLAWDDTLTPNVALAMRYGERRRADLRRGQIEDRAVGEYEVVGLWYRPIVPGK